MRPHVSKFPVKNERDVLLRKARALLNKISPVNYDRLRKRWLHLMPQNLELEQVIEVLQLVVAKALDDTQYMNIYARLMGYLCSSRRAPNSGTKIRSILNTQIHHELKKLTTDKEIAKFSMSMEEEWIARRKKVTLHRFIAELYVENACSSKFLMDRIADIVAVYGHPEDADESLECLCVVLTFAGHKLEDTKKEWLDDLFNKLNLKESEKLAISKRIQFMVLDLLEMRSKSWAKQEKMRWWVPSCPLEENNASSFSSATSFIDEKSKTVDNMYLDQSTLMVTAGIAAATASRQRAKKSNGFKNNIRSTEQVRTLQGILNKVTPITLPQMAECLPQVLPTELELLEKAVDKILAKIISEPSYVQVYVRLISHVSETFPEFERKVKERIVHLVEGNLTSLGGIRLLAELFNAEIVPLDEIQKTIELLSLTTGEPCLASFLELLFLTGKKLEVELKDTDISASYMDAIMNQLAGRAAVCGNYRLRCFLQDVVELRANHWILTRPLNYINPAFVDPLKKPYDIGSIIRIIAKNGENNIGVVKESLCSRNIAEKFVFEGLDWAITDGSEEAGKLISTCLRIVMKEKSLAPHVRPRIALILGKVIQHIALLKGKNSDAWVSFGKIMDDLYSK